MPPYTELQATFLDGDRETPLPINPTDPPSVLVENDQLTARILFIHRLHPEDPGDFPWEDFFQGRRRRFQLIMQVKFKAAPDMNTFFFGMELRKRPMKLNLALKSVSMAILSFVKGWAAARDWQVHYSFGDSEEYAAMCFPIFAADKIAVSREPPPMPLPDHPGIFRLEGGQITDLSKEEQSRFCFDTKHWYTMDYFSSFCDFCQWKSCNVPGLRDISLETFWGQQPATIVMYDLRVPMCVKHTMEAKRYFFELEVQPVGAAAAREGPEAPAAAAECARGAPETRLGIAAGIESVQVARGSEAGSVVGADECADDAASADDSRSSEDGKVAKQGPHMRYVSCPDDAWSDVLTYVTPSNVSSNGVDENKDDNFQECISNFLVEARVPWYFVPGRSAGAFETPGLCWSGAFESPDMLWLLEVRGLVPADSSGAEAEVEAGPPTSAWRTTADLRTLCAMIGREPLELPSGGPWALPAARHLERLRGAFEGHLAGCAGDATQAEVVWRFCTAPCSSPVALTSPAFSSTMSGVARVRGWVCFVEFQGRISEQHLALDGHVLRLGSVDIPLHGAEVRHTGAPPGFPSAGAFLLRLGAVRVLRFFCSKDGAATWVSEISRRLTSQGDGQGGVPRNLLTDFTSCGRWLPAERVVLNDCDVAGSSSGGVVEACLLEHTAELLRCALQLHGASTDSAPERDVDYSLWALASGTRRLQGAGLTRLADHQLWAFWVNVFHLLVVHAWLVLGPPDSIPKLVRFYNRSSYIVAGQVFSIAEVEHLVLRRGLSAPRGAPTMLLRLVLQVWPRSDQELSEDLACRTAARGPPRVFQPRPDWRVSLLLSNGMRSCPASVPVFDRAACASETALERAVALAVAATLATCPVAEGGVIELPYQLCRYRDDAPGRYEGGAKQPADTCWLGVLRGYLGGRDVYRHTFRREDWRMHEKLQVLDC